MTIELQIYPVGTALPLHFCYQMESFSRIVWGEDPDETGDIEDGFGEEGHHFVMARGKRLISYAMISYHTLELEGESYRCAGVGGVMTYPAFRQRGYGGQVVGAATATILNDPTVDIALLWTNPKNDAFYRQHGWETMHGLTTLMGTPPVVFDEEQRMMLFVSQKGKGARDKFATGTVYVGQEHW